MVLVAVGERANSQNETSTASTELYNSTSRNWTRTFCFQAEDGIRAADVTGVQTCALPISILAIHVDAHPELQHVGPGGHQTVSTAGMRSEERRVGKECRSRWSPYH